jgi:Zn ribbon nucleic-acid-binding protein
MTHFLNNCPRCGYVAEAWSEDGVFVNVRCKMCGYEGRLPHPDLKNGAWRVDKGSQDSRAQLTLTTEAQMQREA